MVVWHAAPMSDRGAIERALVIALVVATGLLLAGIAWQLLAPSATVGSAIAVALLHALVPGLASAIAVIRSRDQASTRSAWLLLGTSLAIIAVGFAVRSFGYYGGGVEPTQSIGALGILIGYPLAFAGLALLASDRADFGGNRIWLDALVMGLGVYSVGIAAFSAVLASQTGSTDSSTLLVQSIFVALDLFILALCVLVAARFSWRLPSSWWLVMAAFVVFTAGDVVLLLLTAFRSASYPSLFEVPIAFLLLGLAAYADRGMPAPSGPRRDIRYTVPSLAVMGSLVVLVWRPDGPLAPVATAAAAVAVAAAVARLTLAARDNRRLAEAYRTARTDDLTSLPNRRALLDLHVRQDQRRCVVILDIDDFKDVNSTFGLPAGDRLLVMVGERLTTHVRHPDLLARLGADEFAVVLMDADAESAVTVGERLLTVLEDPFHIDGVGIRLTASAGVAASSGRECELGSLLREADFAMHQAKAAGPGIVRLESGEVGRQSKERLMRRSLLRSALDAGGREFLAYYQPVVRLTDHQVASAEALVRWRHDGVVHGPAEFLPDIDAGGMLPGLTRLMLRRSLAEFAHAGLGLRVAVNVPPDLVGDWLAREVDEALAAAGVEASGLTLEITEDALMRDPATATRTLTGIRDLGVRVLLDDFGTGWSGLSTLRDLAVDGIKIDRSFVVKAAHDPSAWAILESVTSLARALGVDVVAEGAEDPAAVQVLRDLGVDYLQGFIVARPMPLQDLVPWLVSRPDGASLP